MLHIAFNIDVNYIVHCAVTMVSILENNRDRRVHFHIVGTIPEVERRPFEELAVRYGARISYYEPPEQLLEGYAIRRFSKRISLATYYRCTLSAILPRELDRVLYLDCDLIVRGSLAPFYDADLSETSALCIEDICCDEAERYDLLHYPKEYSYFNAGVMLVNLDYWRSHDVPNQCLDYYRQYPERILYNDQDLLNVVLYDSKRFIGIEWNVQDGFYRRSQSADWISRHAEPLRNPMILHYTNRKPWNYDSQHPLRSEYFKYLRLTPFASRADHPLSFLQRIKRFLRLLPFRIGLRKPKYVKVKI